jgi:hypothetical protein
MKKNLNKITRAQVYGMMGSGTNYLDALLRKNFPELRLPDPEYSMTFGWKHGDIGTGAYTYTGNTPKKIQLTTLDWPTSHNTLLFVIYRNPFEWVQSLHKTPHSSPESYGLDFSTFIRSPWRTFYCAPGGEFSASSAVRLSYVKENNLLESFPSVFALRKTRILTFESFKYRFQNVAYVNLEALEQNPKHYLDDISDKFSLRLTKQFHDISTYKGGTDNYVKKSYAAIKSDDLRYLLKHLDWGLEKNIGYPLKTGASVFASSKRSMPQPERLLTISSEQRCYRRDNRL